MASLPLTSEQAELARFLLSSGGSEAQSYLPQLERASATDWRCSCGCASFNFKISGMPEAPPGVHVLNDFLFGPDDNPCGVFIYSSGGVLSGVEVYYFGDNVPSVLPKISDLRPYA